MLYNSSAYRKSHAENSREKKLMRISFSFSLRFFLYLRLMHEYFRCFKLFLRCFLCLGIEIAHLAFFCIEFAFGLHGKKRFGI